MQSSDGRYHIVYNGEVYNFRELRVELEKHGVRFRTTSDTEVVLEGYAKWGEALFQRLNGMFALAIWDIKEHRLILARDPFGIKPLFYAANEKHLLFGSEIKSILAADKSTRKFSKQALIEYLEFGNSLGGRTLFDGIQQLEPGTCLIWDRSRIRLETYHEFTSISPSRLAFDDAASEARRLFSEAVASQMVSDVPVSIFLSGGVDSAAITCFAAKKTPKLNTYCAVFEGSSDTQDQINAKIVAQKFGTTHHELFIRNENILESIKDIVVSHDQPFGDPASLPLRLLCAALPQSEKVILQGDGGDEILAGYRKYSLVQHRALLRALSTFWPAIQLIGPQSRSTQRLERIFQVFGQKDRADVFAALMTFDSQSTSTRSTLAKELLISLNGLDSHQRFHEVTAQLRNLSETQALLFSDAMTLLPDIYLPKVDRATMAFSKEVRVPFLDLPFARFMMSLPAKFKVNSRNSKILFKRAIEKELPPQILRQQKRGFYVPYAEWLKGPLHHEVREQILSLGSAFLDSGRFDQLMTKHVSGHQNHSMIIFKLLQLAIWYREYNKFLTV